MGRYILIMIAMIGIHLKHTLGEGACLVEDHSLDLRQSLKNIGPLNEHTRAARATYPGEERQRYAHHQRTRTTYNQKHQRPINPSLKRSKTYRRTRKQDEVERRKQCERQCAVAHSRSVDPCELRNEIL